MKKEIELYGIGEHSFFTDDNTEVDSWCIVSIYDPSTFKVIQMYVEDYEGAAPKYYTITDLNIAAPERALYTVTISFRDATKKEIQEYKEQK